MTDAQTTFLRRFSSTAVLWTVALCTILGGWEPGFVLLIAGLGLIGLWEYYTMLDAGNRPNFKGFGIFCGGLMMAGLFYWLAWQRSTPDGLYDFEVGTLLLFMLVMFSRQMFPKMKGHVPHISPKQTWEGIFGALAFSIGGACGLIALMPVKLALLNYTHAIILGLVLGFAAVIGDLAESLIKRSCNVKDSGRFLPGIGGALDLIDSILFTAPMMFFYLRFLMR